MTALVIPPKFESFAALLEARGNPMAACREVPWLAEFAEVPENASIPLAMSGPHPRATGSYGAECIKWARESFGVTPRWWQALAVTRQLEHDADGKLVWREAVETAPRRAGKSVRLRMSAVWRCHRGADLFGEQQMAMLVSKDLAVGKEIHRGAWRWAEKNKWNVVRLGGAQEIESTNGDRWLLRAPNAAYGYDVGYGQVDESWGVDPTAITDGLEPALLERESPQLHLTSTAHVKASSLMRRRLTAALRDADPNVLLLMWGAHPDADVANEATWRAASPYWSTDRRDLIARKYGAALAGQDEPEFDDPDPVRGWAAQYLNVWPLLLGGEQANKALPGWAGLATSQPPAGRTLALGIAADLDQVWLSLGAVMDGGRKHLGSVHRVPATRRDFFVAEVRRIQDERDCVVAIDKKGPAAGIIPTLENAGVRLTFMSFDDVVQANSDLSSAVKRGEVEHGDYDDLNQAVAAATWRTVGDRRLLGRKTGDISSLESVMVALWAATHGDKSVYEERGLVSL